MRLEDFDYELPKELIAQTPSLKRDECRLMVLDRAENTIKHRHFYDILEYLHEGDCLVVNDSRVIPARLYGIKERTGAHIELLLIKRLDGDKWESLVKPGKRLKEGDTVVLDENKLFKAHILGFKDKENYWLSKGITVVGFLVNEKVLKEKGLEVPKKWSDLTNPKYKGLIIMSNPAISGTNFGAVAGILGQKGNEKGWEYWTEFNKNVDFYSKRGKDPQEKTAAGEFGIGIIPVDKSAFDAAKKHNLTVVYPEDGIPWIPEGVAIFKNSSATDIAKAFEDFILKPENQQLIAELDGKDGAQMVIDGSKGADLGLPKDRLLKEDLASFGNERSAILKKWKELVGDK